MARLAEDIAKASKRIADRNYKKSVEEATIALREKCVTAVTKMLKDGLLSTEVKLEDEDLDGLENIVEEMRGLNYRHALVEVQTEERELVEQLLRISVEHLA